MSEYRIHQDINLFEIADEYAKRLQEHVDELALDMAAETLAKYGYVKVVRCRDCAKADYAEVHMFDGTRPKKWTCTRFECFLHMVQPDDFCSRGARREP